MKFTTCSQEGFFGNLKDDSAAQRWNASNVTNQVVAALKQKIKAIPQDKQNDLLEAKMGTFVTYEQLTAWVERSKKCVKFYESNVKPFFDKMLREITPKNITSSEKKLDQYSNEAEKIDEKCTNFLKSLNETKVIEATPTGKTYKDGGFSIEGLLLICDAFDRFSRNDKDDLANWMKWLRSSEQIALKSAIVADKEENPPTDGESDDEIGEAIMDHEGPFSYFGGQDVMLLHSAMYYEITGWQFFKKLIGSIVPRLIASTERVTGSKM